MLKIICNNTILNKPNERMITVTTLAWGNKIKFEMIEMSKKLIMKNTAVTSYFFLNLFHKTDWYDALMMIKN